MEVTGHVVTAQSFQVMGEAFAADWMGASPDGLIQAPSNARKSRLKDCPYSCYSQNATIR